MEILIIGGLIVLVIAAMKQQPAAYVPPPVQAKITPPQAGNVVIMPAVAPPTDLEGPLPFAILNNNTPPAPIAPTAQATNQNQVIPWLDPGPVGNPYAGTSGGLMTTAPLTPAAQASAGVQTSPIQETVLETGRPVNLG